MLSISGFGQGGPESHRAAYAPIIHAEAGLMHRQAARGNVPLTDLPLSVADTNASLHGLVGLLSAVILRERTGRGQHIDIAMIDATIATDDQVHYAIEDAEGLGPLPNEVWETGAGTVLLSADLRFVWHLFSTRLGVADPTTKDMDLATKIQGRREAAGAFMATLATWEEVEETMAKVNLAWGKVRDPATLMEQPTVAARGAITQVSDRAGGTRPITQSPYRFSNADSGVRGPAPHRGEHNSQVLQEWLGSSATRVADLTAAGVLHSEASPA
jgi:crotonobetainyl-CoA:carnitine CoA-transferase CaiB-like acyl-CoA transferase